MKSLISLSALFLAAAGLVSAQTMTVDSYVRQAKVAAGMDWTGTFLRLCVPPPEGQVRRRPPGPRATPARETWYARPQKVADNLYFLGTKTHNSWAIVGSEGIIVIEALFDYATKDEVLDGMRKEGLNPNDVKYVILSHGHGDHDGGAKLLQDTIPGVHLIYGAADWDLVESQDRPGGTPKRDRTGDDGMVVSVGDASVEIFTMPGHTQGTLSYLFEVKDNGKPLRIAYNGGTAIPFDASPEYYAGYIASSKKVGKAAAEYGATVLLSNHTEFDNAYWRAHMAASREPGERNPFDVGTDGVANYFKVVQDCAMAAKLRAAGEK